METMSLQRLTQALHQAWDENTGYANATSWTNENPSRGQCMTSSLVVQDYFGGDIVRYEVTADNLNETHYFNILEDGTRIDTTGAQYKIAVSMKPKPVQLGAFISLREKRLSDEETHEKYLLLKSKVEAIIAQ
jgi:hypothetical protein